ncbi:MAG: enoyl-CoA hydratase/isomerase family protein [Deltaproteobacteria bacterium]|jgi:enoyl-CoA hydratase|nr:enoyl-CoA hydratase/isomerase family protein [Deltaproteobacteria bacterium]
MAFENLLFEVTGKVALITMNRPKALNALNSDLLNDLSKALDELEANDGIKGAIITGAGEKAFVAGADISQMAPYNPEQARGYMLLGQQIFNHIESIEKPIMAAVNGFALGGGNELCMACDFRYASTNARFGQPEVNLGIMPGFGGSQRLPRLVGPGIARELIFSGNTITAEEALRIGLVNKVFAQDKLLEESRKIMDIITSKPASALRYCKASLVRGQDEDIYKAIGLERELVSLCFASEDQKEGMSAFLEKRPAQFKS